LRRSAPGESVFFSCRRAWIASQKLNGFKLYKKACMAATHFRCTQPPGHDSEIWMIRLRKSTETMSAEAGNKMFFLTGNLYILILD
ncbi:MAG: hypothetical protein NTX06_02185, partial [Proteobacteria bacterium]|nr:hypothetical protein [Pseudomonadota bacterium]